jgi:hypothetical protein
VLSIRDIVVGIQSLIGCAHYEMLPLMSDTIYILVPPMMLLMHLWLNPFLFYFSLMLLPLLCLSLTQLYLLLLYCLLYLLLVFPRNSKIHDEASSDTSL